jgi:lipopolysaccharide export system permease protein
MKTLQRYLIQVFAVRVLAALAVLVAILQVLDLLDVTTEILDRKLGVAAIAYYAMLRTPDMVAQVAPLSVLAGSLFAFAQLARENAFVALRSSGMSIYRLLANAAPVAVGMALIHLACVQVIAPRAEQALDIWWARSAPAAHPVSKEPRSFRVGSDIIVARIGDELGRSLRAITIYRRDRDGRLVGRIQAPLAVYGSGGWRLEDPHFESLGPNGFQEGRAKAIAWTQGPPPQDVRVIFSDQQSYPPGSAKRALAGGAAARSGAFYRTALQRGWAAPIGGLIMLLLAAPVALINFRSGGGRVLVCCMGAGLLFMVVDGVLTAMGQTGALPAMFAAWAGPALFAAAGASALLYMEG